MKLDSHWTDFDEIWYLSFFQKPIEKVQVSLLSKRLIDTVEKIQSMSNGISSKQLYYWQYIFN